ncbi:Uncharacterised protein [Streptococcus pyogenes]|nr:Uncharacterised protein [Streptococcus pyogenes]VGR46471.1 Uncharacterised protein [Streptococcus pyogenes]VGR46704.1 Uncharacterised protein [Streptococcus pyogenes]
MCGVSCNRLTAIVASKLLVTAFSAFFSVIYFPSVFALITDFVSTYARQIVNIATSDHKTTWTILIDTTRPTTKEKTAKTKTKAHQVQNRAYKGTL